MLRGKGHEKPLVDCPFMANIKSQIKRNHQTGDADAAVERAREAAQALDKAASRGIVHKRTAARRKSRLARAANAAAPSE